MIKSLTLFGSALKFGLIIAPGFRWIIRLPRRGILSDKRRNRGVPVMKKAMGVPKWMIRPENHITN
jgi:hypothetical protein